LQFLVWNSNQNHISQRILAWNYYSDISCCLHVIFFVYMQCTINKSSMPFMSRLGNLLVSIAIPCSFVTIVSIKPHVYYSRSVAFIQMLACQFFSSSFLMPFWKYVVFFTLISINSAVHSYPPPLPRRYSLIKRCVPNRQTFAPCISDIYCGVSR